MEDYIYTLYVYIYIKPKGRRKQERTCEMESMTAWWRLRETNVTFLCASLRECVVYKYLCCTLTRDCGHATYREREREGGGEKMKRLLGKNDSRPISWRSASSQIVVVYSPKRERRLIAVEKIWRINIYIYIFFLTRKKAPTLCIFRERLNQSNLSVRLDISAANKGKKVQQQKWLLFI